MTIKQVYKEIVMKTLLLALLLLLGSASMASPHKGVSYGQYELSHGKHLHKQQKQRFVKVVQSRPVYKEVVIYGECRSHPDLHHRNRGALIGSTISVHPQRPQRYCQYTEQRLVGYRNIAYWHGKKITQFSEKPLRKIAVYDRHPKAARYALQRGE